MPLAPPQGHVIGTGGLNPVATSTIGNIPRITSLVPPQSQDSVARQVGIKFYIGEIAGNLATVLGGAVSNANASSSFVAGEGAVLASQFAVTAAQRSVIIGPSAVSGLGDGLVVIGAGATMTGISGTDTVVIGRGAIIQSPAGGSNTVLIGSGPAITLGSQHVVIGSNTTVAGNNGQTVVGYNSSISGGAGVASNVLVGTTNSSSKTRNILVGAFLVDGNSPAGDNVIIGQSYTTPASGALSNAIKFVNSAGYTTFLIGKGETHAAPQGLLFKLTDGVGADIAGGDLTLQAGLGTSAGAPGRFVVNIGSKVTTGSVLQAAYEAIAVIGSLTNSLVRFASPAGRDSMIGLRESNNDRLYIGAAGAAGGMIAGSATGEACIRSENVRLLFSTDGGTTLAASFTTGGVLTLEKDRGTRWNNQTSAAGASGGTLTNAPTAGNPGHWLKINLNGTNYAIPCWQG